MKEQLGSMQLQQRSNERCSAPIAVLMATLPRLAAPTVLAARWLTDQSVLWSQFVRAAALHPAQTGSAGWFTLWQGTALANTAFATGLLASAAEARQLGPAATPAVPADSTNRPRRSRV